MTVKCKAFILQVKEGYEGRQLLQKLQHTGNAKCYIQTRI